MFALLARAVQRRGRVVHVQRATRFTRSTRGKAVRAAGSELRGSWRVSEAEELSDEAIIGSDSATHRVLYVAGGEGLMTNSESASKRPRPCFARVPRGENISAVSAGCFHSVALSDGGKRIFAWGHRSGIGLRTEWERDGMPLGLMPYQYELDQEMPCVRDVRCGGTHTLLLADDGRAFTFGRADVGQLGTGVTKSRACKQTPHEIDLSDVPDEIDTELIAIASGYSHSLALTRCGRVLSWGFNGSGQLGHAEERVIWRPKVIESLMDSRVVNIACGLETSAVVTESGTLYTFGRNDFAQLGYALAGESHRRPRELTAVQSVESVACGGLHMLALGHDGRVFSWGHDTDGQLGISASPSRATCVSPTPLSMIGAGRVKAVRCGARHSVCVREDGSVLLFGLDVNPEDEARSMDTLSELAVPDGSTVIDVSCGVHHTVVLLEIDPGELRAEQFSNVVNFDGSYAELREFRKHHTKWPIEKEYADEDRSAEQHSSYVFSDETAERLDSETQMLEAQISSHEEDEQCETSAADPASDEEEPLVSADAERVDVETQRTM